MPSPIVWYYPDPPINSAFDVLRRIAVTVWGTHPLQKGAKSFGNLSLRGSAHAAYKFSFLRIKNVLCVALAMMNVKIEKRFMYVSDCGLVMLQLVLDFIQ